MLVVTTFQGGLMKVARPGLTIQKKDCSRSPKRGNVHGMSKRSRKRMLELCATISSTQEARFVTLGYSDLTIPWQAEQAKANLRALMERLRRDAPQASAIWRMECEPRQSGSFVGYEVPHFHLIVFGASHLKQPNPERPEYSGYFHDAWSQIVGHYDAYPDDGLHDMNIQDKTLDCRRAVMYYVSKYAAKMTEHSPILGYVPYPHTGRVWGVHNRDCLPQEKSIKITLNMPSAAFYAMKWLASRQFAGIAANRLYEGFTLFGQEVDYWLTVIGGLIEAANGFKRRRVEPVI